ncbi:MAG: DUF5658 family protein [Planctomycetes bacterium]|jgi:hypothetical protein|nr:DUF5658 family protein [Planctomycetota bacterium]
MTAASAKVSAPMAPVPAALAAAPVDAPSRRLHSDRRQRPTPMLSRYALFGGRRRTVRRDDEREGAFVDVHGPRVLAVALAIVALNLLDAWFTLLFLSHGGEELNPMVQLVLDMGGHPWPFLLLKTVGIGLACALLVVTKHFRPARWGLAIVLVGYSVLLCWHLYLLQWLDSAA